MEVVELSYGTHRVGLHPYDAGALVGVLGGLP